MNQHGLKNRVEEEADVDVRDWFTLKAQSHLAKAIEQLPSAGQGAMRQQWMPGVGKILGLSIGVEIGDLRRFPSAQHLAKYAGVVPQVQSSGGKTWRGPTSKGICNGHL